MAFTYGKTNNTIMTTNNIIQNQLQTARNFYNFFDFNNVKDSRKITALKLGYGKKNLLCYNFILELDGPYMSKNL